MPLASPRAAAKRKMAQLPPLCKVELFKIRGSHTKTQCKLPGATDAHLESRGAGSRISVLLL